MDLDVYAASLHTDKGTILVRSIVRKRLQAVSKIRSIEHFFSSSFFFSVARLAESASACPYSTSLVKGQSHSPNNGSGHQVQVPKMKIVEKAT